MMSFIKQFCFSHRQSTPSQKGFTLPEVLISLALFSVVVTGVYIVGNSIGTSIAETQKTDMEAAFANLKIAEINPYILDVEQPAAACGSDCGFDTPTGAGQRQLGTLANGATVYWARAVDSCPTNIVNDPDCNTDGGNVDPQEVFTSDIKRIQLFLYKTNTSPTPYRTFKKEVMFPVQRFIMGQSAGPWPTNITMPVYRDTSGNLWTRVTTAGDYAKVLVGNKGAISAGRVNPEEGFGVHDGSINYGNVDDDIVFNHRFDGNSAVDKDVQFKFPASKDVTYKITLGFGGDALASPITGVNQRRFDIYINEVLVDDIDLWTLSGNSNSTAVTRTYTATPFLDSGDSADVVYTLEIRVEKDAASTEGAFLSNVTIQRMN